MCKASTIFAVISKPAYMNPYNLPHFPITQAPYYDLRTRCFRNDACYYLYMKERLDKKKRWKKGGQNGESDSDEAPEGLDVNSMSVAEIEKLKDKYLKDRQAIGEMEGTRSLPLSWQQWIATKGESPKRSQRSRNIIKMPADREDNDQEIIRVTRSNHPDSSRNPQRPITPSIILSTPPQRRAHKKKEIIMIDNRSKCSRSHKKRSRRRKRKPKTISKSTLSLMDSGYDSYRSRNEDELLDHIFNIHLEAMHAIIDNRIANKLNGIAVATDGEESEDSDEEDDESEEDEEDEEDEDYDEDREDEDYDENREDEDYDEDREDEEYEEDEEDYVRHRGRKGRTSGKDREDRRLSRRRETWEKDRQSSRVSGGRQTSDKDRQRAQLSRGQNLGKGRQRPQLSREQNLGKGRQRGRLSRSKFLDEDEEGSDRLSCPSSYEHSRKSHLSTMASDSMSHDTSKHLDKNLVRDGKKRKFHENQMRKSEIFYELAMSGQNSSSSIHMAPGSQQTANLADIDMPSRGKSEEDSKISNSNGFVAENAEIFPDDDRLVNRMSEFPPRVSMTAETLRHCEMDDLYEYATRRNKSSDIDSTTATREFLNTQEEQMKLYDQSDGTSKRTDDKEYDIHETADLGLLFDSVPAPGQKEHPRHVQPGSQPSSSNSEFCRRSDERFLNNHKERLNEMLKADGSREMNRIKLMWSTEESKQSDSVDNQDSSDCQRLSVIDNNAFPTTHLASNLQRQSKVDISSDKMLNETSSKCKSDGQENVDDIDAQYKEIETVTSEDSRDKKSSQNFPTLVPDDKKGKKKWRRLFCFYPKRPKKEKKVLGEQIETADSNNQFAVEFREPPNLTNRKPISNNYSHEQQNSAAASTNADSQISASLMSLIVKKMEDIVRSMETDSSCKSRLNPFIHSITESSVEHEKDCTPPRPQNDHEKEIKHFHEPPLIGRIHNQRHNSNFDQQIRFSDSNNNALDNSPAANANIFDDVIQSTKSLRNASRSPLSVLKREISPGNFHFTSQSSSSPVGLHGDKGNYNCFRDDYMISRASLTPQPANIPNWRAYSDPYSQHFKAVEEKLSKSERKSMGIFRNIKLRLNFIIPINSMSQRRSQKFNNYMTGDEVYKYESHESSQLSLYKPITKAEEDDLMGPRFCGKRSKRSKFRDFEMQCCIPLQLFSFRKPDSVCKCGKTGKHKNLPKKKTSPTEIDGMK